MVVWRSGSALVSINEVNLRLARLAPGWVTVSVFNSRCGSFSSVCNQQPRSTQPGHPFVSRRNEYQLKSGDALRLGSKGRYFATFMCGWQVKLCDPLFAHGPYLSALEIKGSYVERYINSYVYFLPRCMECRRGLAMRILSVRLSVTRVNCDKTVERSVQINIPYERTFSLVF